MEARESKPAAPAAAAPTPDSAAPALPDWLTTAFLQEALAGANGEGEGKGGALRVKGFHAENAVGKGDNYASLMLRVRVDVVETTAQGERTAQRSIIVKSKPLVEMSRAWVEKTLLFPKEQRMYRETLPRMQRLLDGPLRGQPFARLTPRALLNRIDDILVFEDLRDQGFKMVSRQCGMDLEHCLMLMKALGLFHAMSLVIHEEDPASVVYEESFYTEATRSDFEFFMPKSLNSLAEHVDGWQGFEHYADKLREFGKTIFGVMMNIFAETEERFKVLNHGDCWVNNTLFKYSESGEPVDIRFVDFQMCRFGSMALDLQYFLFSSPRPDIRTEKMDEMLSTYHTTYLQVLKQLGCEHRAVSWEELQQEMKRVMPFGVMSSCNLLAIVLAEPSEAMEFEGITEEEVRSGEVDIFAKTLAGKTFAKALRLLLPYFEKQGAL
ncbi:hypothetical protein R5R35_001953 [Gryllus longicercus]|uniref:CHK kinase-like domain-containing protein n=1 Tax=Gryllus longicercus TaxID=2509291 RepID=A0AAN9VZ30_9ORTH